ncbi:hypothetical protein PV05_05344 [Exophiala xenobiotica]|uniref:prephenate dehydratase n=1 Tax=Exophiala xenobiotica TaxID=348802 RepID=A0A0D2D2S1_9EURO|nr:uncharacterized protein PV05_05344 [Exophiala xenobiotica]KIW56707.1 hypothetical protein PV05_05344 [Exophiala xenobiotica]
MSYEEDPPTALNIAYLGPEASFSHQAAIEVFTPSSSSSATLHPLPSFSSIFSVIQCSPNSGPNADQTQTSYDYAVIPIENSTNGSVVQVLDLLAQCGLDSDALYPDIEVCAEYYLPVHHCLFISPASPASPASPTLTTSAAAAAAVTLASSKSSIRTLYTHPQVWGQCTRFLSTHFPPTHVERIDVGSTSAAAQLVAREPTKGLTAAIGSKLAGEKHNLVCLAENIEDEPGNNTTRFFVVRNRMRKPKGPLRDTFSQQQQQQSTDTIRKAKYKSLITFTIPHTKPGALADALAVFKTHSFNLTSIDTRPSRKRNWQYVFFVECEEADNYTAGNGEAGPEVEDNLKNMLTHLEKFTERLRYLGRFKDQLET